MNFDQDKGYVGVFACKGKIVMCPQEELINPEPKWFVPTSNKRGGCVVIDTKNHLRISAEALDLMKKIRVGGDAIGDIDWWACDDGTHAFSWWGAIFRVIDPTTAVSARGFRPKEDLPFTLIDNKPPLKAEEVLEEGKRVFYWRTPFSQDAESLANP